MRYQLFANVGVTALWSIAIVDLTKNLHTSAKVHIQSIVFNGDPTIFRRHFLTDVPEVNKLGAEEFELMRSSDTNNVGPIDITDDVKSTTVPEVTEQDHLPVAMTFTAAAEDIASVIVEDVALSENEEVITVDISPQEQYQSVDVVTFTAAAEDIASVIVEDVAPSENEEVITVDIPRQEQYQSVDVVTSNTFLDNDESLNSPLVGTENHLPTIENRAPVASPEVPKPNKDSSPTILLSNAPINSDKEYFLPLVALLCLSCFIMWLMGTDKNKSTNTSIDTTNNTTIESTNIVDDHDTTVIEKEVISVRKDKSKNVPKDIPIAISNAPHTIPVILDIEEHIPEQKASLMAGKMIVAHIEDNQLTPSPPPPPFCYTNLPISEERASAVVDALLSAEMKIATLLEKLPTSMSRIWELEARLEALTETFASHFSEAEVDQVGFNLDLSILDDKEFVPTSVINSNSLPVLNAIDVSDVQSEKKSTNLVTEKVGSVLSGDDEESATVTLSYQEDVVLASFPDINHSCSAVVDTVLSKVSHVDTDTQDEISISDNISVSTPVYARVRISQIIPLPEVSTQLENSLGTSAIFGIVRLSQIFPLIDGINERNMAMTDISHIDTNDITNTLDTHTDTVDNYTNTDDTYTDTVDNYTNTDMDMYIVNSDSNKDASMSTNFLRMSTGSNISDLEFDFTVDSVILRLSDVSGITEMEEEEGEEGEGITDLISLRKSKFSLDFNDCEDEVNGVDNGKESRWKSSQLCSADESMLTDPMMVTMQMSQISPASCLSSNIGFVLGFPSNSSASTDFDDETTCLHDDDNDDYDCNMMNKQTMTNGNDIIKPRETFTPDNDDDTNNDNYDDMNDDTITNNDNDTTCNSTIGIDMEDISIIEHLKEGEGEGEESDDEGNHRDYYFDPVRNKKFVYIKYIGHIFENQRSFRTPTKGDRHGRLFRTYMINGVVRKKGKKQLYFIYYDVKHYPRGPPPRKLLEAWTLCPCRHIVSQNHKYHFK